MAMECRAKVIYCQPEYSPTTCASDTTVAPTTSTSTRNALDLIILAMLAQNDRSANGPGRSPKTSSKRYKRTDGAGKQCDQQGMMLMMPEMAWEAVTPHSLVMPQGAVNPLQSGGPLLLGVSISCMTCWSSVFVAALGQTDQQWPPFPAPSHPSVPLGGARFMHQATPAHTDTRSVTAHNQLCTSHSPYTQERCTYAQ